MMENVGELLDSWHFKVYFSFVSKEGESLILTLSSCCVVCRH
jgi:hypothetical protein